MVAPTAELRVPNEVLAAGYRYFLGVEEAAGLVASFNEPPLSDDQRVSLLLHYAATDAFPDWVYQR